MASASFVRRTGRFLTALAAGGMCVSPLLAQQPPPRVDSTRLPAPSSSQRRSVPKEVTPAADGSVRIAVLTLSGNLIPRANVILNPQQDVAGQTRRAVTGAAGVTVVSGLKTGLYEVRVEAHQGSYQGLLRVRATAAAQGSLVVRASALSQEAPLIAFVVAQEQLPDPRRLRDQDSDANQDDAEVGGEVDPTRRRILGLAALAGGATAIALPLSLSGGGRGPQRASP